MGVSVANSGSFKPGVSGNPGGRPKGAIAEMVHLARAHGPRVIEMLAEFVYDVEQPPKVRIMAGEILLDRGYGKAQQQIDVLSDGKPLGPVLNITMTSRAPLIDEKAKDVIEDS